MGSDCEKTSRLNQRHLGVKNQIWLIVALFLFLLTFTHYVLPSHTPHLNAFSSLNLKPKNYLNASRPHDEPNPFEFCPVFGPGDTVGSTYGALPLSQSRLHLGSGARVQRVIKQAMMGEPVTISVVGGSVSACHGAGDNPLSPSCYPHKFFRWWNTVFPHPASELTNGAMRRTNSGYLGFCSAHHIPEVTDLVIVELDVDDTDELSTITNFELLIRSILLRPDQPAVLILGHFSPQSHQTYGFAGPDHLHNVVAQFYDIPHISMKPILYPAYMSSPPSVSPYFVDPVLASPSGHTVLADTLISYFQSQICTAWDVVTGAAYDADLLLDSDPAEGHGLFGGVGPRKGVRPQEDKLAKVDEDGDRVKAKPGHASGQLRVPPGRINTRPPNSPGAENVPGGNRPFEEIAPFCVSANDLINPLPPSLFYGSGWHAHHPESTSSSSVTIQHYWHSTLPTSKLRIPLQVGAGDIGVYYLQEPIREVGEGSAVECWVDDNYAGAREIANAADVGEPTAKLEVIDHFVSRGSHFVECQLLGEEGVGVPSFRIVGIFST